MTTRPSLETPVWRAGSLSYTRGGLAVLFAWLLWGDFAWSLRDRAVGGLMQLLLKRFEVSDTVTALLIATLPASIGLVLGPVISTWSDRHRGPRGRRLPFLLCSAPLVALSLVGLGLSPLLGQIVHDALGARSPGYGASVVLVISAWWLVYDVASTVTYAVFGALVNDIVPTPVMGRFYGLFRVVSLLVGIAFNFWLLARAETHSAALFIGVGAVFGVGVVSMCLRVREGTYPPPPPSRGLGAGHFLGAARDYFRECCAHPYYLWFFAGSNLALVAATPVNLFSVYYAKSLGMGMGEYGRYIALTYAISLGAAYLLGSLADRLHPLRVGMAALALYALAALWGGCCATTGPAFAAALVLHGVLSGCYFTGAASLGQRLLPQARFAQLSSAGGIVYSLLNIVLPPLLGGLLDRSGHAYRLTFFAGALLAVLALGCLAVVHRHWLRHGGPHRFAPPG